MPVLGQPSCNQYSEVARLTYSELSVISSSFRKIVHHDTLPSSTTFLISPRISKSKIYFLFLQDAFELLFQDINPILDVFEVLATRENDLS